MAPDCVASGSEESPDQVGVSALTAALRAAVFFDRDGVLNRAIVREGRPYPPASPEELELVPGACQAVDRLRDLGFLIFVVTNQPDVGRGLRSRESVEQINAILSNRLAVDEFFVCYHDDLDTCDCRKPAPGLLFQAAQKHAVDLSKSYLVGDRWRDVEAGARAGCATILIDYGYAEEWLGRQPDARVTSVEQAVEWIAGGQVKREQNEGDL